MADKIYRFFRGRSTPAWHQLSKEEQERKEKELGAAAQRIGFTSFTGFIYTCWSSEWDVFGMEEFPSLEAVQDWRNEMERLGWGQYLEIESMIGIRR